MKSSKRKAKHLLFALLMLMVMFSFAGCRDYDKPEFLEVGASQTVFLVPAFGDTTNQAQFESEEFLESKKVAAKRVKIPHTWVKTGRTTLFIFEHGEYQDSVIPIVVERKPVTREWTSEKDTGSAAANQVISAESKESIGFSVAMNCSAQIDEVNAAKFLYRYNNKPLEEIMDSDIRGMVSSEFNKECSKYLIADIIANKSKIMDTVVDTVTTEFADRGITITMLGMKEGLSYDDQKIQDAINEKFSSEQKLVTQENNNKVAISKAESDKKAAILKAEADAETIRIAAEAEAKANKLIAASMTQQLIDMKIAEARVAHGWITIQGSGATIVDTTTK